MALAIEIVIVLVSRSDGDMECAAWFEVAIGVSISMFLPWPFGLRPPPILS